MAAYDPAVIKGYLIEELESGEEFAKLIIQKVCTLHASGGRCY
jgi:hypothetical protein